MLLSSLFAPDDFIHRHIGPTADDVARMLGFLGLESVDELINQTVPDDIRLKQPLALAGPCTEQVAQQRLKQLARLNHAGRCFIGLGYAPSLMPAVIRRNVLENPGWYTAYTPYQPEIAQGRLTALLHFQQMIADLTALPLANASLLDEATAAAEAMAMARRLSRSASQRFFVDAGVLPQTLDVVMTRAQYLGIEVLVGQPHEAAAADCFAALFQYPARDGEVVDLAGPIADFKQTGGLTIIAADLLALVLLVPPGELGADIAIGSCQRFGLPMGYGGPHAAYLAFRDEYRRAAPGRIIGVSHDRQGKPALRMALQTREQHIRREKANSNICTSQVLLANLAAFYAIWHGPAGLKRIALRIHRLAATFAAGVRAAGGKVVYGQFFDTVLVDCAERAEALFREAQIADIAVRQVSSHVLAVSFHEAATLEDLVLLLQLFTERQFDPAALDAMTPDALPASFLRQSPFLQQPVFNSHHTEHAMLRFLKGLEERDLALNRSMIALGSCTMKLNAAAEMEPISWPEWADLHPFAPAEQTRGYQLLLEDLSRMLRAITGFSSISLQPNSGAQGEYAGLLAIRRYHASRDQAQRDICLIPQSAHGTNPATAQMLGLQVVTVGCDAKGNVDVADLAAKAAQHAGQLAALMITYPSTHGVFESAIREICAIIHQHGGQVYMDGANLNAQVGLTRPADIGADVCHINLHKTFCIPHGGGGPGMGPIGLAEQLAPYAPGHVLAEGEGERQGAVSAAPFGSALILPISWMYITMMGAGGLKQASEMALLNANYLASRLQPHYPVLYTGRHGRVAHECIIDLRPLKAASGISESDIAKRLMDYGFHAPTVSFPVPGTFMIEPTESESLAELERFIEAMIAIRAEVAKVEAGHWPASDNPLSNAPHTLVDIMGEWLHPYTREEAVIPLPWVAQNKFWPSVNRIDEVWGDRNFNCSCSS